MNKHIKPSKYIAADPNFVRHTEEINDIIATVPVTLIRWGTVLFICVFLVILSLAFFLRFPTIVNTSFKAGDFPFGELSISPSEITKVHHGQRVVIRFRSYSPKNEFTAEGSVVSISSVVDTEGNFVGKVRIDSTRLPQAVRLNKGMRGKAQIVTEDVSVLKRILSNMFQFRYQN